MDIETIIELIDQADKAIAHAKTSEAEIELNGILRDLSDLAAKKIIKEKCND